jgi:hypothetical protein
MVHGGQAGRVPFPGTKFSRVASQDSFGRSQPFTPSPVMPPASGRFRQVLLRVMTVQAVTLALLWWLQARYAR